MQTGVPSEYTPMILVQSDHGDQGMDLVIIRGVCIHRDSESSFSLDVGIHFLQLAVKFHFGLPPPRPQEAKKKKKIPILLGIRRRFRALFFAKWPPFVLCMP